MHVLRPEGPERATAEAAEVPARGGGADPQAAAWAAAARARLVRMVTTCVTAGGLNGS